MTPMRRPIRSSPGRSRRRGDYEGALAEAERALTWPKSGRRARHAWFIADPLGAPEGRSRGSGESIRLDPRGPQLAGRANQVVMGLYLCRDYEAAIAAARRAIRSIPEFPNTYRWLAAALGQVGRVEEAKEALEKAIAVAPAAFEMYVRQRVPWHRPEDYAHMLDGLRKAGWQG